MSILILSISVPVHFGPNYLALSWKWHYAVQGHSRSPSLVPIESSYATSYQSLIVTFLLSCTVSEIQPFKGPKSLHFSTPLWFNPPTEGFPWDDLRKIFTQGHRWPMYQMAQKHCRKFQSPEQGARTLQTTDRRQTDRWTDDDIQRT